MKKLISFLFLTSLFLSNVAKADILVFIHGFDSNANTWRNSGITYFLQHQGWQDVGSLVATPNGSILFQQIPDLKPFRMLTVELPSKAPIQIQAQFLSRYLQVIQQHYPKQQVTLIAHSAGGIIARYLLVTEVGTNTTVDTTKINKLITIASPHLGSGMAEVAEIAAKTPIASMISLMGEPSIEDAEDLMSQLQREEPGSFLFWLNRQRHPNIKYYSIIRSHGSFLNRDYFVNADNQELRRVPGIQFAQSFPSYGKHELNFRDAYLISRLVNPANSLQ